MIPCVVLLSIDPKEDSVSSNDLSEQEMKVYGIYAVLMGIGASGCWAFKNYYARKTIENTNYAMTDFALDQSLTQNTVCTLLFLIYLS